MMPTIGISKEQYPQSDLMDSNVHEIIVCCEILESCLVDTSLIPDYPPYPTQKKQEETNEKIGNLLVNLSRFCNAIENSGSQLPKLSKENYKPTRNDLIDNTLKTILLIKSKYEKYPKKDENKDNHVINKVIDQPFLTGKNFYYGMDHEMVEDKELRKQYEDHLWKRQVIRWNNRIQHGLKEYYKNALQSSHSLIIKWYDISPRADSELVGLLEKYEYPEKEKAKILKALNIPYKGFREWKTNDGLLTLTAKLISADKKEIKIEKEDGKQFTIEIVYLRKEDQDYVKRQLDSETKTLKNEKSKD
jgi:hypothetical protein